MKKIIGIFMTFAFAFNLGLANTGEDIQDNQIIEQKEKTKKEVQELNAQIGFKTFESCSSMENTLKEYIKQFASQRQVRYHRSLGMAEGDTVQTDVQESMDSVSADQGATKSNSTQPVESSSTDYTETNIQVSGVDEPEIIKNDGEHIYYYNSSRGKIYVINSPLDIKKSEIDLSKAEIIKKINLPETFDDIQMFVSEGRLTILANRTVSNRAKDSLISNYRRTNVIVYDTSDIDDLEILKFTDTKGRLDDARKIDNKVYLISKPRVSWRNAYMKDKVFGMMPVEKIDLENKSLRPSSIELSKTDDKSKQNVGGENSDLPYNLKRSKPDCKDIFYLMPDKDSIDKYNLDLDVTILSKINIQDTEKDMKTKMLFGDASQIHMSKKNLYITNRFYKKHNFRCPEGRYCIMPRFNTSQNTLVHKFNLDESISYQDSTIIPGVPLSQYSMSEDGDGDFRIVTKDRQPELSSNLFILNEDMRLKGAIRNIQPGEEFKSSRFIKDKLYLVTFQQVDPLFAIDMEDEKNPKIVGELKIPGYSSYLHPYKEGKDGIQYLIGLGYEMKENQYGRLDEGGIKVNLYEVNYNKNETQKSRCSSLDKDTEIYDKCLENVNPENIRVSVVDGKTMGEHGSYSESLENPRMFVWRQSRQQLLIPALLTEREEMKDCDIRYDKNGNQIDKRCRTTYDEKIKFAGLKGFKISLENGIQETVSKNYKERLLKNEKQRHYYSHDFKKLNFRVGYLGDAVYSITNRFGHFFLPDRDMEKVLDF